MLAVIRRWRRVSLPLRKGLNRASEGRAGLEHRHCLSRVDEIERSGEPGKAAPDDHDSHRETTARTFSAAESLGGTSNTSNPEARICSRSARYVPEKERTPRALRKSR